MKQMLIYRKVFMLRFVAVIVERVLIIYLTLATLFCMFCYSKG